MNGFPGKGGSDTAFPFFAFILALAVASAIPSVSQAYPLGILRILAFCAVIPRLFRVPPGEAHVPRYALLAVAFVVYALIHSAFSVYRWVSFQHAINLAVAVSLLLAFAERFGTDPARWWERTVPLVVGLGLCETAVALAQRVLLRAARPAGTFGNANYLSEFLAAGALLSLASLLFDDRPGLARRRAGLAAAAVSLAAAALALAGSRAVLIAVLPSAALLLAARFGAARGARLAAIVALPAILLLGLPVLGRFLDPSDVYGFSRPAIWKSALRTFVQDPAGIGLGGFKYFWLRFQEPIEGAFRLHYKTADTAHSEYLEVLAGLGVAGFAMFVALLAMPLVRAARLFPGLPPGRREIAAGSAACLMLSGTNALFNANFHEPGIFVLDAWLLALLLASTSTGSSRTLLVPLPAVRALGVALAGLLAYSVATAGAVASHEIGQSRLRVGDVAGATPWIGLAASLDPPRAVYPDALSAVAFRRFRTGARGGSPSAPALLDESIRLQGESSRLAPSEPSYPARLSSLYLERFRLSGQPADLAASEARIREAVRLAPYAIERHWQLADVLEVAGRPGEAADILRTAVAIEPNFCQGYARLSAMTAGSDPKGAEAWSSKAEACRARAVGKPLAEPERWMLEVRVRDGR